MAVEKLIKVASRNQLLVFSALAAGAVLATVLLCWSDAGFFRRFLGSANPILAMLGAAVVGLIALLIMQRHGYFFIFKKQNRTALLPLLGAAAVLAMVMIAVDLLHPFPPDINILFPESLLFYPAIAFFVEVAFHLLPLGLLLLLLHPFLRRTGERQAMWLVLALTALPEPLYQVLAMAKEGNYPGGVLVYLGVHLFVFDLLQLYTFRRRDFLSMYLLRLIYYLVWHIAWGQIRLGILF